MYFIKIFLNANRKEIHFLVSHTVKQICNLLIDNHSISF